MKQKIKKKQFTGPLKYNQFNRNAMQFMQSKKTRRTLMHHLYNLEFEVGEFIIMNACECNRKTTMYKCNKRQ